MNRSIRTYIALLLFAIPSLFWGQELNCRVEINTDQIQNVNKEVFTTLQEAITEYINTNRWGNAQFSANEKIECTMFFTIKS